MEKTHGKEAFDETLAVPEPRSMQSTQAQKVPVSMQETQALDETQSTISGMPFSPSVVRSTVLPEILEEHGEITWVSGTRQRFALQDAIAAGGSGEVFLARDQDIGREVAVKKIRSDRVSKETLMRFIREIRTVGRLEHPNIVPIHDVGVDEQGNYYFVMKYVRGETLESIIDRLVEGDPKTHAEYPYERRIQVFRSLCEAVAFAHGNGVIHRDIKPANVMVGAHGEVLLMDWGIAKTMDEEPSLSMKEIIGEDMDEIAGNAHSSWFRTRTGVLIGTPAYMAPEQVQGKPATMQSDIYALCVLFHEFLTLKHYLQHKTSLTEVFEGVLHEYPVVPTFLGRQKQCPIPADLSWFLDRGLKKEPAKRYASVREMMHRLDLRAQGIIPVQCPMTLIKRTNLAVSRFTDRYPLVMLTAVYGGIPLLVGTLIWKMLG